MTVQEAKDYLESKQGNVEVTAECKAAMIEAIKKIAAAFTVQ